MFLPSERYKLLLNNAYWDFYGFKLSNKETLDISDNPRTPAFFIVNRITS